jgi:hypothetical protein
MSSSSFPLIEDELIGLSDILNNLLNHSSEEVIKNILPKYMTKENLTDLLIKIEHESMLYTIKNYKGKYL